MKKDEISHTGRIIEITPEVTRVSIIRSSACSECKARSMCGMSDSETKIVELPTSGFDFHNVGDEVEVCLKKSMGLKAVWIMYVLPLIVLVAALLVCSLMKIDELWSGISAIAAVALYYVVIACFRKRLEKEVVFYIK